MSGPQPEEPLVRKERRPGPLINITVIFKMLLGPAPKTARRTRNGIEEDISLELPYC